MTKPTKVGIGVGVSAVVCLALAAATSGPARIVWTWTAASCVVASVAYLRNRPVWLGKRDGRWSWRSLGVLPYLVAFRIACALMRWWRGGDDPTLVAPGLWVGGRITGALPPHVTHVVDLVAEYPEPHAVRTLDGYRPLPTLDGGVPHDLDAVLALVGELRAVEGDVLVHCDSGRGRAPTFAAALLIARGHAASVDDAVDRIRRARPVTRPTRADLRFLAGALRALRELAYAPVPRNRPGARHRPGALRRAGAS